jgi:tetratricopeptide (TPR) repeat protein
MSSLDQLLQEAVAAAQEGRTAHAQQRFMQVVEIDERNETAWAWLAQLVDNPEDKRVCLENTLSINPNNEQAKQALAAMNATAAPPAQPAPAAPPPAPPPAAAAPPPPAQQPPAPPPTPEIVQEYKCPRCGEPATSSQSRCTNCHSSLLVSDPPAAKPSIVVKVLGILWILGGVLPLLGGLIGLFLTSYTMSNLSDWYEYQQDPMAYAQEQAGNNAEEPLNPADYAPARLPDWLYAIGEVVVAQQQMEQMEQMSESGLSTEPTAPVENPFKVPFFVYLVAFGFPMTVGVVKIGIGMGLTKRKVWAYILNIIELVLNTGWVLTVVIFGGTLIGIALTQATQMSGGAPSEMTDAMETMQRSFVAVVLVMGLPVLLQLLLTIGGYSSFFGIGRYRCVAQDVPQYPHQEHYRRGSFYGKKGLWALAAQEWELATKVNSENPNYHHALGLAYAELHEYKKAVTELQKAVGLGADRRELEPLIERIQAAEAGGAPG